MSVPIVFRTTRRAGFSELDPFDHLSTGRYASWFVDHRMHGLQDHLGWDAHALSELGFLTWVRRMEIDFRRPVLAGQEVVMTSQVREFRGSDAVVDCVMASTSGRVLASCVMTVAHVDASTRRATDWPPEHSAVFFEDDPVSVG